MTSPRSAPKSLPWVLGGLAVLFFLGSIADGGEQSSASTVITATPQVQAPAVLAQFTLPGDLAGKNVQPAAAAAPRAVSPCDPNYSGACVPIASDVDCEGGGGNGPAYVKGPVYVIGKDIYGLDKDGNGVGCES
jgi:hypothetical protein